jgi:hypothetical protein
MKEERYAPMVEGVRAVTRAALVAIDEGRLDRLGEAMIARWRRGERRVEIRSCCG